MKEELLSRPHECLEIQAHYMYNVFSVFSLLSNLLSAILDLFFVRYSLD